MTPLILAIPSKGRLQEGATELFANAGIALNRAGVRGYTGQIEGIDHIEVQYLSASEIATRLADGTVHFGITGEDLLREQTIDLDSAVQFVLPLGFGHADVVVAIPDGWVDVRVMSDLAEVAADFRAEHGKPMRVATKYTQLTAAFFARHAVNDYVIVQSFGATEAAPNSGAAEAIVDITSTGATLLANRLRVPDDGVILKSQANLAASLKADWNEAARQATKRLLARLAAYENARKMVIVELANVAGMPNIRVGQKMVHDFHETFGAIMKGQFTGSTSTGGTSYSFQLPADKQDTFIEAVMNKGFEIVTVTKADFIYERRNALFKRLMGAVL